MITKIKRLYRSLILTGTGLLSLILMAFNYLGLFATGDTRDMLKDLGALHQLRLSAYNFFKLNGTFKIEGEKISLDMLSEISGEAAFAVFLIRALSFLLTIVLITSIILLIAGLISGVKDIFKKNLVVGVKPLLLDKISHIVMLVHGISVAVAAFISLIVTIASLVLFADLGMDDLVFFGPRLGAILLLALAIYSMVTIIIFDKRVFRVPSLITTTYTCSVCGVNHKTPSQFCPACGGAVGVAQTQASNPYYIDDTEVENFDYSLIPLYAKKAWGKGQDFLKEKNISRDQLIKGGAIFGGAIVVLVLLISILSIPDPKYIMPDQYLDGIYDEENEETVFVAGGKMTDLKVDGEIYGVQRSMDGTVTAFVDEEDTLYVIRKNKMTKVTEEVKQFKLSVEGTGIAYINEDGELMLYSVKKDSSSKITDELYNNEYTISPDGKSIAYAEGDYEEYKLYVSVNGKDGEKVGNNLLPIALSNKGKFLYYLNTEKQTVYVVKSSKEPQKLASLEKFSGTMQFNADHTQVKFSLTTGTYISNKGKEAVKISSSTGGQFGNYSDWGYVIGNSSYAETLPIKTFAKQYFRSGDSLYYLNKRFKAIEVEDATDVRSYKMTLRGDVIYYRDKYGTLYRDTGNKANIRFKEVAESVTSYTVSSNGKFCYYKTYDGSLMCVKKAGRAKLIADDVDSYYISHDDYLFFLSDNDLFVSHNRRTKKSVETDVEEITLEIDGSYYYVEDSDELVFYGASKKAKFSRLIKIEY